MTQNVPPPVRFDALGLPGPLVERLSQIGYETAFPIQEKTIPPLLEGRDVVGQAQTGTGKTAAFALPLISKIAADDKRPQILVLSPTRELAVQTAEAFSNFAEGMKGVHIQPICGGRGYREQISGLRRGAQVVVGTPGRIMDLMEKEILDLSAVFAVVLDEADEMLRMGFIESVEWVLEKTPKERQTALFSATMPPPIRRIAQKYLNNPLSIALETKLKAAATVEQRYIVVSAAHKDEALLRLIEGESPDGVIVFVRTRSDSTVLADTLIKAGLRAAVLNGDLAQADRERTVDQLKSGMLDILVATDVAARGLDVERISHVVNYDPPNDPESYVHRIGRCGRAGRNGLAILLLSKRDRMLLKNLERAVSQQIEPIALPSAEVLNKGRAASFKKRIVEALQTDTVDEYRAVISQILEEDDSLSPADAAAALAALLCGNQKLLLSDLPSESFPKPLERNREGRLPSGLRNGFAAPSPKHRKAPHFSDKSAERTGKGFKERKRRREDDNMESFRVQVGATHGLKPSNLVGAIANEADLSSKYIGRIEIFAKHSTVDLPAGMPHEVFQLLRKVKVCNRPLNIERVG